MTEYEMRATVAELRAWLQQFSDEDKVFVGGTATSGYIIVSSEQRELMFALLDDQP